MKDRSLAADTRDATHGQFAPLGRPFLTARWLHLAMLNFEIDPAVLAPLVPRGTELDTFGGRSFVSLVGFQFRDTRVCGLAVPFHRHFEEVNLRFYVRRGAHDGWRRGVVFVKEFAPRVAIAWIARMFYGENYATVAMRHRIETGDGPNAACRASYYWKLAGQEHGLELVADGPADYAEPDSEEAFITEHYWGYSGGESRRTIEYRVDHSRWKVRRAREARFDGDAALLYGVRFVEALSAPPSWAFLADGSEVTVYRGERIAERSSETDRRVEPGRNRLAAEDAASSERARR